MSFDIYQFYKDKLKNELLKEKSSEEIEEMDSLGEIHELLLKRLAKALSVVIFRNGLIEDIHAGVHPDLPKGIPDSVMKDLNIDICNRTYTILKMLLEDDVKQHMQIVTSLYYSEKHSKNWNEPQIEKSLCSKEYYEEIMKIFYKQE